MRLTCSLPGLLLLLQAELSVLAQQTRDYQYWWLGLASPFGGRNYNLEQVAGVQWYCSVSVLCCNDIALNKNLQLFLNKKNIQY